MSRSKTVGHNLCVGLTKLVAATLVLAAIFTGQSTAQEEKPSVYLEKLTGSISGSPGAYRVVITGKVVNSLPFDVVDVRVVFLFSEDTVSPLMDTTITRVAAGKSSNVSMVKNSRIRLTHYRAGVTDFVVLSNEVNQLLSHFQRTSDPVLQTAIVRGFSRMKAEAVPSLLDCIGTSGREPSGDVETVAADLMCLDALTAIGDPRAIGPLLDLLAWYSEGDNINLFEQVRTEVRSDPDIPLGALSVFSSTTEVAFFDLIVNALIHTGSSGVPALLRGSASHPGNAARQAASQALVAMGKTDVAALLDEHDEAILEEIVAVLGELRRVDAVVPMLELADRGVLAPETVEYHILAMKDAAVSGLVQALYHRHGSVADRSERLLRRLDPQAIPQLQEELQKLGGPVPVGAITVDGLVDMLVATVQAQMDAQIDSIFERGWQAYQTGNCNSAAREMDRIFEVRDDTRRHATQIAIVYQCSGQVLAASGKVTDAISDLRKAQMLAPENPYIRTGLMAALLERGRTENIAGNRAQAIQDFRDAVELDPAYSEARRLLWAALVGANPLFLVVATVSLLTLAIVLGARPDM